MDATFNSTQQGYGVEGYKIADPTVDPDCDVPICYQLISEGWTGCVAEAINRPEFIANLKAVPNGRFAIDLIQASKQNELSFFHYGDLMYNP